MPDEVCVVVRAPESLDAAALYERVRVDLNTALRAELGASHANVADDLARDLRPTELMERFGQSGEVLQPLERPGIGPRATGNDGERAPWLSQPDAGGQQTWKLYYAIGNDRVDFATRYLDERLRRMRGVRQLVNLCNRHHAARPALVGARGEWDLLGASPNWLTAAAPMGCGCPAGMPVPEPRQGRWTFQFGADLRRQLEAAPDGTPVVVAVLDTCPDRPENDHANPFLRDVLDSVHMHRTPRDSPLALHARHFDAPADVATYWNTCLPWWHDIQPHDSPRPAELEIADHGLFVAGVIHDVAPDAEIHLVRVLDDFGIGDELGLAYVLRDLPRRLLGNDSGRRLVINLSLGASVPIPPRRHRSQWLPATHGRSPGTVVTGAAKDLLDASHISLWSTIHWLHGQGALVVAASGNDGLRPSILSGEPPPPRYPARYQQVFAVAAADASGGPASYSNRADVPPIGNGITTFGGAVVEAGPAAAAVTATGTTADGRRASVVGVYSADRLPGGAPNPTGWVQWAGTSFAAPVVSGLAARLWGQGTAGGPDDLMQRLRAAARPMASVDAPRADPDGPLNAPLLDAWQEYQP